MQYSRSIATVAALFLLSAPSFAQQKDKEPEFPTTEEIQLAVTQAERVLAQYKQSVAMEAELPSAKNDPSAVEKDRAIIKGAEKLIAALKVNPEGFNGVAGLLLLSLIDDASRNAALCSGTAVNDGMQVVMTQGNAESAKDWLRIGQGCVDVSGYLYTVGESVQALLVREMEAQEMLNQQMTDTANKCVAALKACHAKQ
jgi:hypothetical protein